MSFLGQRRGGSFNLLVRERVSCKESERERVLLILCALPREPFLEAISAGFTADSDIDNCCEMLAQLVTDQREQSLARGFVHD
ncbi:hypothetical protein TSMEX_000801 [Taenia solium]|eukprot:TsM_001018500 transcript=TsM_001018500 gene=TsM_001018500